MKRILRYLHYGVIAVIMSFALIPVYGVGEYLYSSLQVSRCADAATQGAMEHCLVIQAAHPISISDSTHARVALRMMEAGCLAKGEAPSKPCLDQTAQSLGYTWWMQEPSSTGTHYVIRYDLTPQTYMDVLYSHDGEVLGAFREID
jgi:hypothetical protein